MQTVLDLLLIAEEGVLGSNNTRTGIFKKPVKGTIALNEFGLVGDFQADQRVHGGLEKAIHHYAAENFAKLKQALPDRADKFEPGSIGENFSTQGITEEDIHIGDTFSVGSCLIQVSQPRRPCWKLNETYGNTHLATFVMQQQISGWYYRVLQTGELQAGDTLKQQDRMDNSISVAELWREWIACMQRKGNALSLMNTPGLAMQWLNF